MPLFNDLDLGPSNPWKKPASGQSVGIVQIPGGYAIPYSTGGTHPSWQATFMFQAQYAVGAFAAGTQKAVEYLGRQLEELARNPDLQPCYVQLFAGTNLPVASWTQPQDGWYIISHCEVDYTNSLAGVAIATLMLEFVSPGPPRRIGMWTSGAALVTTGYNGTPINWVALPVNSVLFYGASATRTGGEGAFSIVTNPSINPLPFTLSATISDWFKGGCHVYDAMAALATNPVPGAPTFLNTSWVEVKGVDHRFVGDVVITNGLLLMTLKVGDNNAGNLYLWDTALGTPGWLLVATLTYNDNAANLGQLRQITLRRVGMEDVIIEIEMVTGGANHAQVTYRLQRGAYAIRADFRPQSQANSSLDSMDLITQAAAKVVFNSAKVRDPSIDGGGFNLAAAADFGYATQIIGNNGFPYLTGMLWQNAPAGQPRIFDTTHFGLGDSSGPAKNAVRSYGFFAIPQATPANLTATADTGAKSGGFVSVVDGTASDGNTAKCPNTTVIGAVDLFGTAWTPAVANYQCYVRVKCTTATSGTSQMQLGIWDSTSSAWVVSSTLAPNAVTTTYGWYATGATFVPGAHTYQFRAANTATCTDDWFIDEAVLIPTAGGTPNYPQDIDQQWAYLRDTKMVFD